ncbi:site-specific DNA-methyltransferase [Macromonas bipunctata]|uniref:site-specific DNA-methyltransferase n=1 Tax=Macromonas bipunctata TaxID=183670 RepID=UPI000C3309C8|nr:site-specific DNA-methyltransferase [Macromonas bipunctata]
MPTLNWIGKDAVTRHHKEVPFRLLEPVPNLSCGNHHGQDSGNLIVQGDNLHALKALLPRYAGQVKCIYIDPPYNTGNEGWAYNDNVNSPEIRQWLGEVVGKEGETLDRHDRWLCMMYPRLVLLKQFLREDGAIFISIDDNEVATLRLLMDEIFGASNFAATFIWEKRTTRENRRVFSFSHDYVLCYARRLDMFEKTRGELPLSQEVKDRHKNPDNDPRGPWQSVAITAQAGHGTSAQFYTITTPGGRQIELPHGNCWRFTQSKLDELIADNRIYFGVNGNNVPRQKKFLSEVSRGLTPHTLWQADEVGTTDIATKTVLEIMERDATFETPKSVGLLQRILQIATDQDSIILDSFAGSGTTGHAILKQNAEDGGNRRFILVEMDEHIAQNVTAERVRRVAQGYTSAKGQAVQGLGGGFQFCRLSDQPLFDAMGEIRSDVTFAQLVKFVWFSETQTGYSGSADSPLLGVHEGRAIYLLYNGILKDKSVGGGNVLTPQVFNLLPTFAGPKVIYAAADRMGARAAREGITFKQTPYALEI